MSVLLKRIGQSIKKYREIKSITQEELSSLCNLHRNYISSVENGQRNLSMRSLEKIATGLNIKIERLFDET